MATKKGMVEKPIAASLARSMLAEHSFPKVDPSLYGIVDSDVSARSIFVAI